MQAGSEAIIIRGGILIIMKITIRIEMYSTVINMKISNLTHEVSYVKIKN